MSSSRIAMLFGFKWMIFCFQFSNLPRHRINRYSLSFCWKVFSKKNSNCQLILCLSKLRPIMIDRQVSSYIHGLPWCQWMSIVPSLLRAFPLHFLPSVSVLELSDSDGLFWTAGIINLFGDVKQLLSVASFASAAAPDEKYAFFLSYFPSECCWPDMAGGDDVVFDSVAPETAAAAPVDDVPMPCRIVADENVCEWCGCDFDAAIDVDGDLMRRGVRSHQFNVCMQISQTKMRNLSWNGNEVYARLGSTHLIIVETVIVQTLLT